jgi:hypothetical protein
MRAVLYKFSVGVLGGGLAAGLVAFFVPVEPGLVLDVYLLFLGAAALLALVRTIGVAQPGSAQSPFDRALLVSKPRPQRPPDLVHLEQQVALAATTAFDVHFRLRPVLREIAGRRLWRTHAVDFEADPERAESLLGADVWELVRPDRPPPDDPFAAGLDQHAMDAVVEKLERA